MNERYLSRGKSLDANRKHGIEIGDWFVGYLAPPFSDGVHSLENRIPEIVWVTVDPTTIGQCTGLCAAKSCRGEKTEDLLVFEGDIVKMHQFLFDGSEYENELIGTIAYDKEQCTFCLSDIRHLDLKKYMGCYENEDVGMVPMYNFYGLHEESWEIIGNIHDDPKNLTMKEN